MCTVTYIPNKEGFILTSNRDESLYRPQSLEPASFKLFGQTLLFPKDPKANGTWIATSDSGRTICLLNGGFVRHIQQPEYRKSRGLVLLDYFQFENAVAYANSYDFSGVAPFTIVIVEEIAERKLTEIRWTGEAIFLKELNQTLPFIWSSVTLYSPETIAARDGWFTTWLGQNRMPNNFDILDFHHFAGGKDNTNSLIMRRPDNKQTVSITQIERTNNGKIMRYEDLLVQELFQSKI
jgi:hypothetical protein